MPFAWIARPEVVTLPPTDTAVTVPPMEPVPPVPVFSVAWTAYVVAPPVIVMSRAENRSIHDVPSVPPVQQRSALIWPVIVSVPCAHTSTHAVELSGLPSVSRQCGPPGGPWPSPVDSTIPEISTSQPSRWTRSAPGSSPRLLTKPFTLSEHPATTLIGPPPGTGGAPAPV